MIIVRLGPPLEELVAVRAHGLTTRGDCLLFSSGARRLFDVQPKPGIRGLAPWRANAYKAAFILRRGSPHAALDPFATPVDHACTSRGQQDSTQTVVFDNSISGVSSLAVSQLARVGGLAAAIEGERDCLPH